MNSNTDDSQTRKLHLMLMEGAKIHWDVNYSNDVHERRHE